MLKTRHLGSKGKNGAGWAYFTEVSLAVGHSHQQRFADAIAMSLYPSRGLVLHGYEIKASRTDWLKELRDPTKSEGFIQHCDYWWLVAEPDIVEADELPATWGLLVRKGGKLVSVVKAPELEAQPYSRQFLSGLLRAASVEQAVKPEVIRDAETAAAEKERLACKQHRQRDEAKIETLRKKIEDFETEAGIKLSSTFPVNYSPAELGAKLKLLLEGQAITEQLETRLARIAEDAAGLAERARALLPEEAKKRQAKAKRAKRRRR